MNDLVRHITNFYLYSSLHIGLCSVYLYLFTISRFNLRVDFKYVLFTLSSTIFIYSIHRLIGINKVKEFSHKGRFAIIEKFKNHILVYAVLSFLGCCFLFLNFDWSRIILISGAGLLSILYTIPIFGKAKRLRDVSFIKIFLIGIVWSYVTGVVPMYEQGLSFPVILSYFLEIIIFFIAITIPFDIRDYSVDASNNVSTIPTLLGRRPAIKLALLLIWITLFIDVSMTLQYDLSFLGLICMATTCVLTFFTIKHVSDKETDYYFSGLLDTTIMFPYSLYVLINLF